MFTFKRKLPELFFNSSDKIKFNFPKKCMTLISIISLYLLHMNKNMFEVFLIKNAIDS